MEAIVIVDYMHLDKSSNKAFKTVRKSHEFSDRLFVVEGDRKSLDALRNQAGLTVADHISPDSANLSVAERLSLEAWQSNREPSKLRPGDGLSWGHEGFEQPK